ncbi:MAG: capsular polysaccharide biosynthesis protein CapF [Lachnospiraceae bacterium]
MKILVTGAKGFVGKNIVLELKNRKFSEVYEYDMNCDEQSLDKYCSDCNFIFHLAGVNRPKEQEEFMTGNFGFTSILLDTLKKHHNHCPIMISSSIQAELDNPYGQSKKAGEKLLFQYAKETGSKVLVYRFPNVFGKWCKPNYNSVVATFCNNIANDLPIKINDPSVIMNLVYIDDVVDELINGMNGKEHIDKQGYCYVPTTHEITLGEIVDLLYSFKQSRKDKMIPDMTEGSFSKKLYATYLSYIPKNKFSYPLEMNIDERGSFTEIIRTKGSGQFSVNISKPGITKGNHWHHTKNEKFVVVSGDGLIQFRKIGTNEVIEYNVSGEKIEVVDIPTGYTHNIVNKGTSDMVTFMWCNECYNPDKPDTFFEKVDEDD